LRSRSSKACGGTRRVAHRGRSFCRDSLEDMPEIYPEARTSQRLNPDPSLGVIGRGFVLKTKKSLIGEGVQSPSLIGRIQDGDVVGIELVVGAAGD
jgi:hypothetical protein